MSPRIKFGLIAGVIGLVLNICIATAMGICGPLVALLAGAAAAFFTVQSEQPATKGDGARTGAIAGSIAGFLVLIGQMIGGLGALLFIQNSDVVMPFGTIPAPSADVSQQLVYYLSGLAAGACFGLVGIVAAALAGAAAGYLGTSDRPVSLDQADQLD
jgi:hypothetical protein